MKDEPSAPKAASRTGFWNPAAANSVRTLIFGAIGALVGLGIAGYGLFTAPGTTTVAFPAEDAAIVNGVPILMADLLGQLRALYDVSLDQATPQQKQQALDDMIREELLVQRGIELGMPSDDIEVRTALVGATEAQTTSEATAALPDDAELKAFYDSHPPRYASEGVMTLSDWIVPANLAADAASIVAQVRTGKTPASLGLVSSKSLDDPEQFYFAAKIHLGPDLFAAAERIKSEEVSEPLAAPDGIHILVMKSNVPPVPTPFEQAKAQVVTDYVAEKKLQLLAANVKFLRKRARIAIAPELQ